MILSRELLQRLRDFGLNSYEAKLWVALLSRGVSTAGELSDIAGVPRSRSYDVLESLERKGFIITKLGKPIKYITVPPQEVIERVKKRVVEEAESQTKSLDGIRNSPIIEELQLLHNKGIDLVEPTDMTGSIHGRAQIYTHMEGMIKKAEKSIVISATDEGFSRKIEMFKHQLTKAKQKGIKINLLSNSTKKNQKAIDGAAEFSGIYDTGDIKGRFCIIDSKEVLFMLLSDKNTHPTSDVAVWIQSPFFASSLEQMAVKSSKQIQ